MSLSREKLVTNERTNEHELIYRIQELSNMSYIVSQCIYLLVFCGSKIVPSTKQNLDVFGYCSPHVLQYFFSSGAPV